MLKFNSTQLIFLISTVFFPFVRILSFFSMVPVFNEKVITKKIKIVLSFAITWLTLPFLPKIHTELCSYDGFLLLLQQILIGIILGFVVQFIFVTINLSGEIIGLQMNLSFATFFNSNNHLGISIISRLFNIIFFLFFLVFNAHLYFIYILIDSFYKMPIDSYFLDKNIFFTLLQFFSHVFIYSMIFALPMLIFLLILNIIMGILNRISPQISIFSIGFALSLLVGTIILYFFIPITFVFFKKLLNDFIFSMLSILFKM